MITFRCVAVVLPLTVFNWRKLSNVKYIITIIIIICVVYGGPYYISADIMSNGLCNIMPGMIYGCNLYFMFSITINGTHLLVMQQIRMIYAIFI